MLVFSIMYLTDRIYINVNIYQDIVYIYNNCVYYVCTGIILPTGMEVQFLVAATGSKSNPQSKIISSVARITTADWKMRWVC